MFVAPTLYSSHVLNDPIKYGVHIFTIFVPSGKIFPRLFWTEYIFYYYSKNFLWLRLVILIWDFYEDPLFKFFQASSGIYSLIISSISQKIPPEIHSQVLPEIPLKNYSKSSSRDTFSNSSRSLRDFSRNYASQKFL